MSERRRSRFGRSFYARDPRTVARELLGQRLVRLRDGRRLAGRVVETEAYCDAEGRDLACHGDRANGGRPTPRSTVMFGPAGHAYVYFTYGMHWMFNVVTGDTGVASAVLVRALEPEEGIGEMQALRKGRPLAELTNGPAKLAQALAIDKGLNGVDLCAPAGGVFIEAGPETDARRIDTGPRIGLGQTPEPWLSMPWRFWLRDNQFVSH